MKRRKTRSLVAALLALTILACGGETPVPRPKAYFRIDLPAQGYQAFDTTWPYAFEYSTSARIVPRQTVDSFPYWLNIEYPGFRGTIHLSYRKVEDNIHLLLDDGIDLANAHIPKATAMEPSMVLRDSASVYGLVYEIHGPMVASTCQFYLTDSVRHFVRGALYFNVSPNNDSLAPVIEFVHRDIGHLINTFRWK